MMNHRDIKTQRRSGFVLLASVLSLCLCVSVVHSQSQSRTIETLNQMIDALGGQTFIDVDDIHTTGRYFAFTRGELSGSDLFVDYIKFPDSERTELGTAKNKAITINHGKEGMKVEGKKDPADQTPGEIAEFTKGFKTSFD